MQLATVLTPMSDVNLQLAAQCGVTEVVHRYPGPDAQVLRQAQQRIASFGMRLSVVEGYLPIENIKLGCDDGTELAALKTLIRQMGDLQIPLLCYNFMTGTDWLRTRLDAPERGGARVTAFHLADVEQAVLLGYRPPAARSDELARQLTPDRLWEQLERMLQSLLPVAEECGVTLAMHPDDPPLPELLGQERIMFSNAALRRAVNLVPSPSSGICYCVGSLYPAGEDVIAGIHELAEHIHFVHARNVRGTATHFTETWHDNGEIDMPAVIRALKAVGYEGTLRPDHAPSMAGESNETPGYEMLGRLYAAGYLRGLMQAA